MGGAATVFLYGAPVGRALTGLGVRFVRAAEAPLIHMGNEDDATLQRLIDGKVAARVTEEAEKMLTRPVVPNGRKR